MGEFFKPWQRNVGVLTLMMACVLMAAWLRGRSGDDDQASLFVGESTYVGMELLPHEILFRKFKRFPESNMSPTRENVLLMVPYWSLVVPLTLISAYLLLIKRHKSSRGNITEPIAIDGT